jgi:hypothetical protein
MEGGVTSAIQQVLTPALLLPGISSLLIDPADVLREVHLATGTFRFTAQSISMTRHH